MEITFGSLTILNRAPSKISLPAKDSLSYSLVSTHRRPLYNREWGLVPIQVEKRHQKLGLKIGSKLSRAVDQDQHLQSIICAGQKGHAVEFLQEVLSLFYRSPSIYSYFPGIWITANQTQVNILKVSALKSCQPGFISVFYLKSQKLGLAEVASSLVEIDGLVWHFLQHPPDLRFE